MRKLAVAVAAVLFALAACGGGGSSDSPANPARRACQLIDAAGETPGTRERQHSQYIAQAADLLRQSNVEGARQVAAQLDELNRRPVDVSDRVEAWDTGAEWCLAHDLPGDPQATATPATTPAPTAPVIQTGLPAERIMAGCAQAHAVYATAQQRPLTGNDVLQVTLGFVPRFEDAQVMGGLGPVLSGLSFANQPRWVSTLQTLDAWCTSRGQ
jgi:hypothetical protein